MVRIIGMDFARRHRNAAVGFTLDPLNDLYEVIDFIPAVRWRPFDPVLDLLAVLDPVLDLVVMPDPLLDLFQAQIDVLFLSVLFLWCPSAMIGVTSDLILDLFQTEINPAINRLVADHDAVDVSVLAGEIDSGADFPFVALLVAFYFFLDGFTLLEAQKLQHALGRLLDAAERYIVLLLRVVERYPECNLETELVGDRRYLLETVGRLIKADRPGVGRNGFQVAADLCFGGRVADVVGVRQERRV